MEDLLLLELVQTPHSLTYERGWTKLLLQNAGARHATRTLLVDVYLGLWTRLSVSASHLSPSRTEERSFLYKQRLQHTTS